MILFTVLIVTAFLANYKYDNRLDDIDDRKDFSCLETQNIFNTGLKRIQTYQNVFSFFIEKFFNFPNLKSERNQGNIGLVC